MADLTHGAVDTLVGLLSMAIKDEARLLGGVEGDMQFIKDEMESMNGFLLHLTKTEVEHDDQLRAWMKQVRDIAYIAQDCIELYVRDCTPPEKGFWGFLQHLPVLISTIPTRHRVANKIRELKVRVREVGERRMRYDVTVPRGATLKKLAAGNQDNQAEIDSSRAKFLRALESDKKSQQEEASTSFSQAIALLPSEFQTNANTISTSLQKRSCSRDDYDICMEMLLRAFRAYPQGIRIKADLVKLLNAAAEDSDADLPWEVMVFCYSKLSTHYKSCLQYLCAFSEEKSVRRTSLVRRWVAEGLVEILGNQTHEEAAERCFAELLFRGFLLPCDMGATGKVKSCTFGGAIKNFVMVMSRSENFVSHLPTHLDNQVSIRKIVNRRDEDRISSFVDGTRRRSTCGELICLPPRDNDFTVRCDNARMDEMVKLLKSMPPTYRLNVLDLGGCRGLNRKGRLLRSIWDCKVVLWLKYLSLRNTDVKRLPRQINKLQRLETLDIRQTSVRHSDTEHIYLTKLRHLLAADVDPASGAVRMPRRIRTMREMEILSHVQISPHDGGGGADKLDDVGNLPKLRKLGVVLDTSKDNITHLVRAICSLKGCLRSLSIIFSLPATTSNGGEGVKLELGPSEQPPALLESLSITGAMLPAWIRDLKNLTKITLCQTSLSSASLQELDKQLPALRCLRLRRDSYSEPKLNFGKDEFKALEFLEVQGDTIRCIAFDEEDGSAPPAAALEKIVWKSSAATVKALQGISRLPRLQVVELMINETRLVRSVYPFVAWSEDVISAVYIGE